MLREIAPRIIRAAFAEATSTVVKTVTAKSDKVKAGLRNKNLPTTGGAKATTTVNRDEKVDQAIDAAVKANNGKRLSDKDLLDITVAAYHNTD